MYEFLTVKEVATLCRMSQRRVLERVQAGDIKAVKPFGRVLIYKDSLAKRLGVRGEDL